MPETTVKYVGKFTAVERPVERRGMMMLAPGQSPSGYGNRISTDYMIRLDDDPKRLRRVYCICHSNVGTLYILIKGEMHIVREVDLEVALGR